MRPKKSAGSPASPHGTSKRYARCKFESSSLMFLDGYCLSVVAKFSCFHLPILGNLFPHVSHFQASFPLSPITPSSCTQTEINASINLPWTSPLSRNLCPDVPVLAAPPRLETPPAGPFSNGLSHPFWWIKKLGMAGEIENHWVAEELLERKIEDTLW